MGQSARPWLTALKDKAARGERPPGKAQGRWLGDFLTADTVNGLLDTELALLETCAGGWSCEPALAVVEGTPATDAERKAARETAVAGNVVRAGFLRFLALKGDESAPIHEAGVELHNALIDGPLDLRGGDCVGRLMLINCVVRGAVTTEDASLGVLVLRGSRLAGLRSNRARIAGSVFLDEGFVCESEVLLFSAHVGGSLMCARAEFQGTFTFANAQIGADVDCTSASFARGIEGQGANIVGNVKFGSLSANRAVSIATAQISGSLNCGGATLRMDPDDPAKRPAVMLDFSRATIKGDVELNSPGKDQMFRAEGGVSLATARIGGNLYFWGASIAATGTQADGYTAVNGLNARVEGSVYFGGGFEAVGLVSFTGAEISKDLDFSDGTFRNPDGQAIVGDWAKVAGIVKCQTTSPAAGSPIFQAFGTVSLVGAECGELNCRGGTFDCPAFVALDCSTINVRGSVFLKNNGPAPFQARGPVRFFSARIGQHLDCGGGRFSSPDGEALNAEASTITGCVFLNACDPNGVETKDRPGLGFRSEGRVTFVGATVSLQMNCQRGRFHNAAPDRSNDAYAAPALDLGAATIRDTLFLGAGEKTSVDDVDRGPAVFEGSLDLSGTTVRVLIDDGLPEMRPSVTGDDGRARRCILKLDLFSYDRLTGEGACKAELRKAWLDRQRPEDLRGEFQPQPFEQLIKVLRDSGHNSDADEIAVAKRTRARQARPDGPIKLGELVILGWFVGYGYRVARALGILLVIGVAFAGFYASAFRQGDIAPSDKDLRNDTRAAACANWSPQACPALASRTIPQFNPLLYSADVMIPVINLGQKAAWTPVQNRPFGLPLLGRLGPPTDVVYLMQLLETVLGWIAGTLLLSFVSGLVEKD